MARIVGMAAVAVAMTAAVGCTTSSTRLTPLQVEQRQALYRSCMETQLEHAAFGAGHAVHEACQSWAGKRIRATL